MPMQPTDEQVACLDAFLKRQDLTIQARAGTGKTSTCTLLAYKARHLRGLYLAYNRSMRDDAVEKFPSDAVTCKTTHSLARPRAHGDRLEKKALSPWEAAKLIGAPPATRINADRVLSNMKVVSLAREMVMQFCHSADTEITTAHAPYVKGIDSAEDRATLAEVLLPYAQATWRDALDPRGELKYEHDYYLKDFCLTDPQLPFDYVLLDEAQDTNPAVADLFERQQTQKVAVGDSEQALYPWRGAVDAMKSFQADVTLYLTLSFRFGAAVAEEANKWLTLLGAHPQLTGNPALDSRLSVLPGDTADAILCRTNAEVIENVIGLQNAGTPVAIAGKGDDLRWFATGAKELQERGKTSHRDLFAFSSWLQVREYVEDGGAADLSVMVRLIDRHGPDGILRALDQCVTPKRAKVLVSTAHKSKGLEWDRVRIADDFNEPLDKEGKPTAVDPTDAMLAYVSVTRAKHILDRAGLAWVDSQLNLLQGGGVRRASITRSTGPILDDPWATAPKETVNA